MFWLTWILLFVQSGWAVQPITPSCENPRDAVDTLLAWQQPGSFNLKNAATCLEEIPNHSSTELARKLKKVLDGRGHFVDVPGIPSDPDYQDEEQREHALIVEAMPELYLHRVDEGWMVSQQSLYQVPRLYEETFSGLGSYLQLRLPPMRIAVVQLWQLVFVLSLILAGLLFSLLINEILFRQVLVRVKGLGLVLNREVFNRTRRPVRFLMVCSALHWGVPDLGLGVRTAQVFLVLLEIIISISAVAITSRWIDVGAAVFRQRAARTESKMDDQLVPLATRAAKVIVLCLGLVFVLQNMGIDVGSLLAGLGIGGLAIALAAKDTLANLFGSLTIFLDRPFHVGDWVNLPGKVEGVIESIGFRSTRIRTFHNSVVSLPNAIVVDGVIDNMGMREYRRFKTTIGLTYDTPSEKVQAYVEGVRAIVAAHPDTRKDFYEVHFRDFGSSSLDIMLYLFLQVPDWRQELVARSQLLMEFMRLAEALDVQFAYPSQSLYLQSTPEHPLSPGASQSPEQLRGIVEGFGPGGASSRPQGPQVSGGFFAGG